MCGLHLVVAIGDTAYALPIYRRNDKEVISGHHSRILYCRTIQVELKVLQERRAMVEPAAGLINCSLLVLVLEYSASK